MCRGVLRPQDQDYVDLIDMNMVPGIECAEFSFSPTALPGAFFTSCRVTNARQVVTKSALELQVVTKTKKIPKNPNDCPVCGNPDGFEKPWFEDHERVPGACWFCGDTIVHPSDTEKDK